MLGRKTVQKRFEEFHLQNFTISIKFTPTSLSNAILFGSGDEGESDADKFWIWLRLSKLKVSFLGTGYNGAESQTTLVSNTEYVCTVVRNSTNIKLYLNNVLEFILYGFKK